MAKDENVQQEGSFETGNDEFFKFSSQANAINLKSWIDKVLMHDTQTREDSKIAVAAMMSDSQQKNDNLHALTLQVMQNAITTSDMIAKAAVNAQNLATDRMWNVDEQSAQVAQILRNLGVSDAIIAETLAKMVQAKSASK